MGSNSYGQLQTAYGKANKYNQAKRGRPNMGHRNCNNIFNPMVDGEEPCCEDCLCEEKERCMTLKFFPSKEQFEIIKLYYLDRNVDMNITSMFELTDKQFNELLEIHMHTLGDRTKVTQCSYINRLRDFYSSFYRNTPKERKALIKLLKEMDIEPDMDPNGDDMQSLKYNGITETQRAFRNFFELLLDRTSAVSREERIKKEEEYYETILIPKFDDLAKRGMIGKRWWLSFESAFRDFSIEFIKKYLTRFSGKFLLSKRMEFSELRENPDIKEIIKLRLEENIKDELGIYGIKDDLVNIDVDFDLDQVSLFKYLEEDNYNSDKECCDSGY